MLTVSNLSVRIGDLLLFDNVNFSIDAGDRIGLVGANGTGKSTLLRVLAGDLTPDTGSVSMAPGVTIGYLKQGFGDIPRGTLADLLDVPTQGLYSAQRTLDAIAHDYADPDADLERIGIAYEKASDNFEAHGGYTLVTEIETLLDRFGLGEISLDRPLGSLSGGQKTRAGLAALLATKPDILILDEPTNHLDESALQWLGDFLQSYQGAYLIVSHDRAFLDDAVMEILAIDHQKVRRFVGDYSDYAASIAHERDEAEAAWYRQRVEVARIERDIRATEAKARNIENNTIDFAIRKKAAKIARPMVVRKAKLERMLGSADAAERPERSWGVHMDLGKAQEGAKDVVIGSNLSIAFAGQTILDDVSVHVRAGDRVAITGANGAGKTTLMRILGGYLQPDAGEVRRGPGVRVGYFSQEQETLNPDLTVLQQANTIVTMSETELRNELHKFLFGGDTVHKRVGDLSYGERARLTLAMLVLQQTNLLLLDEPLNHLDINARESFEQALLQFNGTMLMVLHDRYAIDRLSTREWLVADGGVTEIATGREV
ncbi:MAG: ABC-F family ATP-binding cassette domain-containing protein [Thermomicrobiales bacterium]|nr:ABC-F family ATP-binding cassette domain-containing protein [Thermomicrobiales bacterium]